MKYEDWDIVIEAKCCGHGDYAKIVYFIKDNIRISSSDFYFRDEDLQAHKIIEFLEKLK